MDFSLVIWAVICAVATSAAGILVGYFIERYFIHRNPFSEKVYQTMHRISVVARGYRVESDENLKVLRHLSRDANKAIGLGLITKAEVSAVENDSLSKSNLSFGLVLPLSLFLYAVAFRLQFHAIGFSAVALFVLLSNTALVMAGFDRLCSYRLGLQSLILGRFEKQQVDRMEGGQKG